MLMEDWERSVKEREETRAWEQLHRPLGLGGAALHSAHDELGDLEAAVERGHVQDRVAARVLLRGVLRVLLQQLADRPRVAGDDCVVELVHPVLGRARAP